MIIKKSISEKLSNLLANLEFALLSLIKMPILLFWRILPVSFKQVVKNIVPSKWFSMIAEACPTPFLLSSRMQFYKARLQQIIWKWIPLSSIARQVALGQEAVSSERGASLRNPQLELNDEIEFKPYISSCMVMSPYARYDIVILPIIDWSFRFQRPQQIARQFAEHGHRVFYVATTFKPRPEPTGKLDDLRLIANNIVEVQLPGSPQVSIYRDQAVNIVVEEWCEYFDQLRRKYNLIEVSLLVDLPFWRPLAFRLREQFGWRVIYDCMDRHSGFSTNNSSMLEEEEELSRGSDLVLITSNDLLEEQQKLNPHCLLVPNACDFEHFSVSLSPMPSTLALLRRPIIGYYGAISDWFDSEMVAEMAQLRPDWSIVLIGSTFGARLDHLQSLRNVLFLGELPYKSLPAYLHGFDICLIPFKLIPLTMATNPVKLYEYLCAGKPVVAVPLPELLLFEKEGLVYIVRSAQELVESIKRVLNENNVELVEMRRQFAQRNTWEERFVPMDRAFRQLYAKASIIVLTYNNLHLTKLCVDSIFRNTIWPNFELIIVDNASKDATRDYLEKLAKQHENVKLILNDHNEGFAGGNNQGIRLATGEYIVPLNNDTIVTHGWLARLIRHLESDAKIGLVGPVTNSIGNEAKIEVEYSCIEEMEAFSERQARQNEGKTFEIKMLALFCAVTRRKLFYEIGLLDERYEVGMFEDDDLASRLKKAGYRLLCCEDVFIHHFHGAAFNQLSEDKYKSLFKANRNKFEAKWGVKWEPHEGRTKMWK
jgi:GT2 family glycosyltransferase/glycosyltransferase involved in cell wall biosynthesis